MRIANSYSKVSSYDVGLREYMISVFNNMFLALIITGLVSYATASSGLSMVLFAQGGILGWLVIFAPLIFVFVFQYKINTMSVEAARVMLWTFAALMGLSISSVFIVYTGESIVRVFFITACMFAGMSLWGYTTKRDLTAMGSFLIMGLFGIIIASLVNMFMQSSAVQFVVSILSVLIFTGLTAYDVQKIAQIYNYAPNRDKAAILGSLTLYMNFINLFMSMLRLFGDRK